MATALSNKYLIFLKIRLYYSKPNFDGKKKHGKLTNFLHISLHVQVEQSTLKPGFYSPEAGSGGEVQIPFTVDLLCDPKHVTLHLCSSLLTYKLGLLPELWE